MESLLAVVLALNIENALFYLCSLSIRAKINQSIEQNVRTLNPVCIQVMVEEQIVTTWASPAANHGDYAL